MIPYYLTKYALCCNNFLSTTHTAIFVTARATLLMLAREITPRRITDEAGCPDHMAIALQLIYRKHFLPPENKKPDIHHMIKII